MKKYLIAFFILLFPLGSLHAYSNSKEELILNLIQQINELTIKLNIIIAQQQKNTLLLQSATILNGELKISISKDESSKNRYYGYIVKTKFESVNKIPDPYYPFRITMFPENRTIQSTLNCDLYTCESTDVIGVDSSEERKIIVKFKQFEEIKSFLPQKNSNYLNQPDSPKQVYPFNPRGCGSYLCAPTSS